MPHIKEVNMLHVDKETLRRRLKNELKRSENAHFLHRLHCVLLVAQGCSSSQVAEWFGDHPRTVERWLHRAREYGPKGLKDEQKTGRPPKVRDDQRKRLQGDIHKKPTELGYDCKAWDGKLLQTHLAQRYGVEMGVRQCQRLLNQLRRDTTSPAAVSQ
jgi:transposase